MRLVVATLTGKPFTVDVEASDTTDMLATRIEDIQGTPPDQQKLIIAGKALALEGGRALADYGAHEGMKLHMFIDLFGGAGGQG